MINARVRRPFSLINNPFCRPNWWYLKSETAFIPFMSFSVQNLACANGVSSVTE